jgi:hypothetical protein
MDSLLTTTKTALVNMFLSATMTRKIFMWYFIERLLDANRLPASVSLGLRDARQHVAKTISTNMLAMITHQASDKYSLGDDGVLVNLASSVLEASSLSSIVLVMSFVTDEMLSTANNDRMNTTELMHEVLAGLMVYADTIDRTSDGQLHRLHATICHLDSADFFPGITHDIDIDDGAYIETSLFAQAQMAASAHVDYIRERLLLVVQVVDRALAYEPNEEPIDSGPSNKTEYFYPSDWQTTDHTVAPTPTDVQIADFAAQRMSELDKLGRLANSVAQTLMLIGVQRVNPNQTGLRFNYASGGMSAVVDEDTITAQTKVCLRRAKEMRAFQGIALSLVRALVVRGHRSHVYGRTKDYPTKVMARQTTADEFTRLQILFDSNTTHTESAKRTAENARTIEQKVQETDILYYAWNVGEVTEIPKFSASADETHFTDTTYITTRVFGAIEPHLLGYSQQAGYEASEFLSMTVGGSDENQKFNELCSFDLSTVTGFVYDTRAGDYTFDSGTIVSTAAGPSDPAEVGHPLNRVLEYYVLKIKETEETPNDYVVCDLLCEMYSNTNRTVVMQSGKGSGDMPSVEDAANFAPRDHQWWSENITLLHNKILQKHDADSKNSNLAVNRELSQALYSLLVFTLPQVRNNLLGHLASHTQAADQSLAAAEISLASVTALHTRAERRHDTAEADMTEADLYQASQSNAVVNHSELKSIGTTYHNSVKYDSTAFQDAYNGRTTGGCARRPDTVSKVDRQWSKATGAANAGAANAGSAANAAVDAGYPVEVSVMKSGVIVKVWKNSVTGEIVPAPTNEGPQRPPGGAAEQGELVLPGRDKPTKGAPAVPPM